jgi:hypothetical protein
MKFVRVAIFLAGMMGLVIGGLTGVSSLKNDQEQAEIRSHENLKSQAALLVDQFFGVIEHGKAISQSVAPSAGSTALPYVTHRAVLKLSQGSPEEFETFASFEAGQVPDLALEARVLQALKNQLSIGDLNLTRQALGTYEISEGGAKEGLFIATPVASIQANGTEAPIEKVNVVLIDPIRAFSAIQKFAQGEQTAFLVHKNGRVLNHTVSSFIGADLRKTDSLKDVIENLFLGAQTGAVESYVNPEGNRNRVALVRAGVLPFAFAVEEKAPAPVFTTPWIREQAESGAARKSLGFALVLIAIALISFSVVSAWASREVDKQISNARESRRESRPLPNVAPSLGQNKIAPSIMSQQARLEPGRAEQAAESFVENRRNLENEKALAVEGARNILPERDSVNEFLARIPSFPTLEGIEKELVTLCAELTESPVLYFRYQRRNQSLGLAAVAGEVRIPNHSLMQAYVRKDIELQVEQLSETGRIASLNNYGPMSKLMLGQLNVAHFEAWGVTSSPEVSGQSKMTGVLVVLQAGMKSAQVRPSLARVLAEAGNVLYARSNKLESRATRNTRSVIGMDLESGLS